MRNSRLRRLALSLQRDAAILNTLKGPFRQWFSFPICFSEQEVHWLASVPGPETARALIFHSPVVQGPIQRLAVLRALHYAFRNAGSQVRYVARDRASERRVLGQVRGLGRGLRLPPGLLSQEGQTFSIGEGSQFSVGPRNAREKADVIVLEEPQGEFMAELESWSAKSAIVLAKAGESDRFLPTVDDVAYWTLRCSECHFVQSIDHLLDGVLDPTKPEVQSPRCYRCGVPAMDWSGQGSWQFFHTPPEQAKLNVKMIQFHPLLWDPAGVLKLATRISRFGGEARQARVDRGLGHSFGKYTDLRITEDDFEAALKPRASPAGLQLVAGIDWGQYQSYLVVLGIENGGLLRIVHADIIPAGRKAHSDVRDALAKLEQYGCNWVVHDANGIGHERQKTIEEISQTIRALPAVFVGTEMPDGDRLPIPKIKASRQLMWLIKEGGLEISNDLPELHVLKEHMLAPSIGRAGYRLSSRRRDDFFTACVYACAGVEAF